MPFPSVRSRRSELRHPVFFFYSLRQKFWFCWKPSQWHYMLSGRISFSGKSTKQLAACWNHPTGCQKLFLRSENFSLLEFSTYSLALHLKPAASCQNGLVVAKMSFALLKSTVDCFDEIRKVKLFWEEVTWSCKNGILSVSLGFLMVTS